MAVAQPQFAEVTSPLLQEEPTPETVATAFKKLSDQARQKTLQTIYDNPDKMGVLGILLARAGVSQEMRKLTPGSRPIEGRPDIHEATNWGETLVAVATPQGDLFGLLVPSARGSSETVLKVFSEPGLPKQYAISQVPTAFEII